METITRDEAFALLKKYNKDPFHIQHALTVEAVMKWYANELGYGKDAEYWGIVGLLHDIDFELYPEEHCLKAPEMLREAGVGDEMLQRLHQELKKDLQQGVNHSSSGIGLINVHQRIKNYYGEEFGISVESNQGEYTCVKVCFPVLREEV